MANYYNVCAWKHTGFDYYNRPFSRDVLNQDYFLNPLNYIQMQGIAVKRDDMDGLQYIDLPGSVKDLRGDQQNAPNSTGTHGPGGPWYSWEEVDYIRLTRTGYPGDDDFVDISANQHDPWNVETPGKLFVAYYFVTGLKPLARNVTRLYLLLDEWVTMGGADELEIESGFKIRGPISDAEDAAGYNTAPESVGLIEPLTTISSEVLDPGADKSKKYEFIVSSTNLTQYDVSDSVSGFVAQAVNGQSVVFPSITMAPRTGLIILDEGGTLKYYFPPTGTGFFDGTDPKVQHNVSVLFSAGQLELQDSYTISSVYCTATTAQGRYTSIKNNAYSVKPKVSKDIGTYPRKADYMYGEAVLFSTISGNMSAIRFDELTDSTVDIWAICTPSGTPYARFKGIKSHPYKYDKCVQGMPWFKSAVVLQGASGSMWSQISNGFAQQNLDRSIAENRVANAVQTMRFASQGAQLAANTAIGAASLVGSGASVSNLLKGGQESIDAAKFLSDTAFSAANLGVDIYADSQARKFRAQSLTQAQNQLNAAYAQQNAVAPYASFLPDLGRLAFSDDGQGAGSDDKFGIYIVNTGAKDRQRLKNYFKRYGYSGLYKPLTWDEINIKKRVNYIQTEATCLKHSHYPLRMTVKTSTLLNEGLFLWNEKPDQAAFDDNTDN